jgi:hypothetical protein
MRNEFDQDAHVIVSRVSQHRPTQQEDAGLEVDQTHQMEGP